MVRSGWLRLRRERCPSKPRPPVLSLIACAVASAASGPITVPIDNSISTIDVIGDFNGFVDTDSSPVSGFITVELDDCGAPTMITMNDFQMVVDNTLNFSFVGGELTATAAGVMLEYGAASPPTGPAPIVTDDFTFVSVPVDSSGIVSYNATGFTCFALQLGGMPCSDSFDLSQDPTQTADMFDGTVTIAGGTITISTEFNVTQILDEKQPDLGSITISGFVTGTAELPPADCPGDASGDQTVDLTDLNLVLGNFGSAGPAGDANNDGSVDLADLNLVLGNFGTSC